MPWSLIWSSSSSSRARSDACRLCARWSPREVRGARCLGSRGRPGIHGYSARSPARRPATATAVGEALVIEIDRTLMRRILTEYPDVAARMHTRIADQLMETVNELGGLEGRLDAVRFAAPTQ